MKLSDAGFDFLVREEGLRLEAYPDAGGWAIGIGCQTYEDGSPVRQGDRIDRDAALRLARWHVARVEAAIAQAVRVELAQPMFDALASLAYNIGTEAFARSTLVKRLNEELYADAAAEFDRWNQSQGAVNATLVARRARERALFESAYRTQAQPAAVPAGPATATAPAPAPIDDVFAGGEGGAPTARAGSEPVRPHGPDAAGPTPAPATPHGGSMDPLTALAALGTIVPDLIRKMGGGSPTAERNAQIAEIVVPVAKKVAGVDDTAVAVGKVLSDPGVQAQFKAAAAERWEDVAPFLRFDEESRGKAREFADRMTSTGPVWREVGYAIGLVLVSAAAIGVFAFLSIDTVTTAGVTDRLREKVFDQWQLFAAAAFFFWLGSSSGSRRKDAKQ